MSVFQWIFSDTFSTLSHSIHGHSFHFYLFFFLSGCSCSSARFSRNVTQQVVVLVVVCSMTAKDVKVNKQGIPHISWIQIVFLR